MTAVLRRIADEVRVDGDVLSVRGHAHRLPGADGREAAPWVAHALYHRYYHRHEDRDAALDPFARADSAARRPATALEDPVRGRLLREACAGRFVWEAGWTVLGPLPGTAMTQVERDGLLLCVAAEELRPAPSPTPSGWAVRFPAQRPFASIGYFSVIGTCGGHAGDRAGGGLVRCYLHLADDGAIAAFAALVRRLDARAIPFSAKVANNRAGFDRPDSAVLYIERAQLAAALRCVAAVHADHRGAFEDGIPAFTRAVAPGVALADEPSQDHGPVSFGQHRCALLAEALVAAGGSATAEQRMAALLAAIAAAGLDAERLHLNADAADYDAGWAVEWPA